MSTASRFAVAQRLLAMIVDAKLPEGSTLPVERELAKQLFVGRGLLREALRILELQGVLSVTPGRGGGIRVRRPSVEAIARDIALLFRWEGHDLEEIVQTRRAIEVWCVRELCRTPNAGRLRRLRRSAAAPASGSGERGSPYALFHHLLVAGAENRSLLQMYRAICRALYLDVVLCVVSGAEDHATCVAEHHAIVDAIEAGNADLAEARLSSHLTGSHLQTFINLPRRTAWPQPRARPSRLNARG